MSEVEQAPENFYKSVIQLLRKAQEKVVRAVNNTMVMTYFEIGRMIVEEEQKGKERAEYGRHLVTTLSQRLSSEFNKGFSLTNVKQMRSFYLAYSKGQTLSDQFKLRYSETDLEQELIDKLEHFLLELGTGFAFVARQKRISFDDKHFRIDLVFYNRLLKCFVLIDLKIGELKHQDIGQIQMYVNYYDREVKLPEENNTIGLILCRDKSEAVIEYTLPENNKQIFASKYQTVLPSKEKLKQLIERKEY